MSGERTWRKPPPLNQRRKPRPRRNQKRKRRPLERRSQQPL